MNMPGMSGQERLPRLRARLFYESVPAILFTTSSQQQDYHFALQHNAGFITKPMTYPQMDLVAEKFLRHCTEDVRGSSKNTR
jgi:CheY-like chemotaxis protein